ncbi:ketopantoate reductase family protein [Aneurinibacillus tyrosinisolvens]|uniref:ketopantoate reductase family protein n=1 Tax=Aneurinibacillus tyrosinisolvens TaxID=1443435 RepID=UPI00063F7E45|nr:ketopantoate reductase family protein [Aneurinibacillus tyrosinisolvens]
MRVLVVGAGAIGGYFGGRLLEKGADVTFLVREKRQKQLNEQGLVIHSIHGDAHLTPQTMVAGEERAPFDLIIMTTKAYHFEEALETIRPYAGEATMLLPLLNGMAHMDLLREKFGSKNILGGFCFIEATLNERGEIEQKSKSHELVYGELDGSRSERITALEQFFQGAGATYTASEKIVRDMWHKYLFISTFSGMTTLVQAPAGPVLEAEYGPEQTRQLFEEIASIMKAAGAPIDEGIVEKQMNLFGKQSYGMKSSMLRDMEKGIAIESDQMQGYLLALARHHGLGAPLLQTVYYNLKVYEMKREKEMLM